MRKQFRLRPLAHIYDLSQAPLNSNPLAGQWPCLNVMVSSNRITRRWDHEISRTFDDTETISEIPTFRTYDGTQYILALTGGDAAKVTGSTASDTYEYITKAYTTGHITNITADTPSVVTGSGTNWLTSGLAAGDKFIVDGDFTTTAAMEPCANWATIASIGSDTALTLTGHYAGTHGSLATVDYRTRMIYGNVDGTPGGNRWQYASVAGKFCFGNGYDQMQVWTGTGYSTDLNTTYCNQVRYCVPYANRLVTADSYDTDLAKRNPWRLRWSKEGDPTNWTDDTSGFNDFIDTEEPIMGLGVAGENLIVFKNTSYYLGLRTGQATSAIGFPSQKKGIGLYAPYSIVHAAGSVAWMGIDDFYFFNGSEAEPVGDPIRKKFFDLVSDDEAKAVFGINNIRYNEVLWVANTSSGQYIFAYDWKEKVWSTSKFSSNLTALGGAGI